MTGPRKESVPAAEAADLDEIETLIGQIEGHVQTLDSIRQTAKTIHNHSDTIMKKVDGLKEALERQTAELAERVGDVRAAMELS